MKKKMKFLNGFLTLLIITFTLCCSPTPGGGPPNGEQYCNIIVTKSTINCGETSVIKVKIYTSDELSKDVQLTITKNTTHEIVVNMNCPSIPHGVETPVYNFSCAGNITENDTYKIDGQFTDNGTTHYANSKSITIPKTSLTSLSATIEVDYMGYANYYSHTESMFNSCVSSFSPENIKINLSKDGPTQTTTNKDFTWDMRTTTDFGEWVNSENGFIPYVKTNRQNTSSNYTITCHEYKVIQPDDVENYGTIGITGDYYDNENRFLYSLVFLHNIDRIINNYPDLNRLSYYSQNMNHELLHQLGKILEASEHTNHTEGNDQYKCALNQSQTIYNYYPNLLNNLTLTWPICERHITTSRSGIENYDTKNQTIFSNLKGAGSNTANEDKLEITLAKKKYKLFEPIEVIFKYINEGFENDSIYLMFDEYTNFMKFNITNEDGKTYNNKNVPNLDFGIMKPKYLVKPSDTLIAVMQLNYFGRNSNDQDSLYLGNIGFFPVGKYRVYAFVKVDHIKEYYPDLISNLIEFEILPLNDDDKEVLKLLKKDKFSEITNNFQTNDFIEYVYREQIRNTLKEVTKGMLSDDLLKEDYLNFMKRFPNSYYGIHYMHNYLRLVCDKNENSIISNIQKVIEGNPDSIIEQFFNNKYMKDVVIKNLLVNKSK